MTNYLRCCAGCSAHIVIYYETAWDEAVYCKKCNSKNKASWADFNPQPHPARDNCVRRYSQRWPEQWVVLARNGDIVTVRALGSPSSDSVDVHVSDLKPRSDRRY